MPVTRLNFADRDALLATARELGVEIPYADDPGILLEPITIGRRRLHNRIVIQPMEGCDADADGAPTDLTLRRYRRYGAGGSGLIFFEATAVVAEGCSNRRQVRISSANVGAFARLVEQTRVAASEQFGEGRTVLLILQLTHAGRYAKPEGAPRPVIAQHNPLLGGPMGLPADYPLISDDELDRLQDSFIEAARCAAAAGFDGVDVKACHGYLVSELLASFTRTGSRYGGSFANRTRFLRQVIARIRDAEPSLLVTSRLSAYDGLPHPFGFGGSAAEGPDENLDEPIALARQLRDLNVPMLNMSIGNPYYDSHYGRPYNKPVIGGERPVEHPLVAVARLLRIAGALQRAVPDVPVVGTGYSWLQQHIPHVGAAIVQSGKASLIGLGRAAFAYPDAAADLMKCGRLDPHKVCIACSCCSQLMRDGGCAGCVVRDGEVYATEYRRARRQAKRDAGRA